MNEIIELINDNYSCTLRDKWDSYDGVLIKTNKQEIKLLISNGQGCCEHWGYLTTHDIVGEFVGAKVLEVRLTDAGLKTTTLDELEKDSECSMVFCTVKTDRGDFQFTAYNSHNGYYSHTVRIISEQVNTVESV